MSPSTRLGAKPEHRWGDSGGSSSGFSSREEGRRRVDPIQLAQEAGPRLTSMQELRAVFDEMRRQDKQSLINGGLGYGDRRDDRDREEMARRAEREAADD
jgi:hypothetical protein